MRGYGEYDDGNRSMRVTILVGAVSSYSSGVQMSQ